MSHNANIKKVTVPSVINMKKQGEKIAVLTAYDFLMAEILDRSGIDIILVGDSAGMVVAGFSSTLRVTMDMMLYHVAAVSRGVKRALVVADMPFLSYQKNIPTAIENAGRFLSESGAEAVKMEGGEPMAETVNRLTQLGIPVMGHLGLTPQSINSFGGYGLVGKEENAAKKLLNDARSLQQAGVFAIVLEKVPATLAGQITSELQVPTIGIGAGAGCDGQVLVAHDMLGIFEKFVPKFVRRYAQLGSVMQKAFEQYKDDVKNGEFPAEHESY